MSRKSQTQKKRHTKPCRYFQVNRCPHAADVCDFAHVIVNPAAATSHLEHGNGVCQYYASGQCSNGALCGYPHVREAPAAKLIDTFSYDGGRDWAAVATHEAPYLESPTISSSFAHAHQWSQSPFLNTSYPAFVETALVGMPARCRDSIDTVTTSTSFSTQESDEISSSAVTDDPRYGEHSHSYQSQVCIIDDPPLVHVTPYYASVQNAALKNPGPSPPYDSYGAEYQAPNGRVKGRNPSKPPSKQKMMKYKTKPCKFFTTSRGCPNGTACTFVHDEMEFPESPGSKSDSPRREFFPIPWRVIGGGVLVGVTGRQDEEGDEGTDEAAESYEKQSSTSKHHPTLAPIKIVPRQRSNSIPPTPSTLQVKVERLFSAESPGVL